MEGTITDLAWAAGFIDGEGCIGVYTNGDTKTHVVSLSVSQLYSRPLDKLVHLFGGHVKSKHSPVGFLEWRIYGNNAKTVLGMLQGYLVTNKKEQAQLAIEFQELINTNSKGKKLSIETLLKRDELAQEIKNLKRLK